MKAIKVTQEIKDKNKDKTYHYSFINSNVGDVLLVSPPTKFFVTEVVSGGYEYRTDLHELDGFFEVVIPELQENEKLGQLYIDEELKIGTYIIETIPEKTNEELTASYMQKLQSTVVDLRIRAKGAAIGKTGARDYIVAQVEFYEIKNEQCLCLNNPQDIEDLLLNEAQEYGITLAEFKELVISRYNEAKEKYNLFMRMIERCRTKIQTLIENTNWESVESAFALVSTLQNADQAEGIMDDILSL